MPKKLRVIQYRVEAVAVLDDGENLVPIEPRAITVPVDKWADFYDHGLKNALAQLEKELTTAPPENRAAKRRAAKGKR